jgi:hypothetical protein
MALLHDQSARAQIEERIRSLRSDRRGRWGRMTVDQMLWHLNEALGLSLGDVTLGPGFPALPAPLLKFVVLRLPWFKGAPTHPLLVAKAHYDFDGERDRLLALVERLTQKSLNSDWPRHPAFGAMTGREVSHLMAKHLDHHLRQFGA